MPRASVPGHNCLILATVHQTTDHVGGAVTEVSCFYPRYGIDSTVCQGTDHGTVSMYCTVTSPRIPFTSQISQT